MVNSKMNEAMPLKQCCSAILATPQSVSLQSKIVHVHKYQLQVDKTASAKKPMQSVFQLVYY